MLGFLIVLLASTFFCVQNVVVRVLFNEHELFGVLSTGGFVTPTLQNSFLLMFMRTLVVVPLMAALATKLYTPTWKDLRQLKAIAHRHVLWQSVGCGVLMFLYLAMLYVAIGLIPTGIALTLFFTYPVFTAFFSWRIFGDRPSLFRWAVMVVILVGSALTMPPTEAAESSGRWLGIVMGIASGIAYASYTIVAQKSFEHIHPVPFTWVSFATTLLLSTVSLLIWPMPTAQLAWLPLWMGGLLSAVVTFAGHLINNFGIRLIGATSASMIGATNPALTVVLAWFAIQETLNAQQLAGVIVVTLSVALLSQESRLMNMRRAD